MELADLESLINPLLQNGKKFISYECGNLLNPGENFGSIIVWIVIKFRNKHDQGEELRCVGKLLPPNVMWNIFNPSATFKYEIMFYKKLVPILNGFFKERCGEELTFFAECFGARLSLDPRAEEIDKDAVILLEDVSAKGFKMCDKIVGFDRKTAELLLRDLAKLHAVPLAFKFLNENEFKDVWLPLIKRAHILPFRKVTMDNIWRIVEKELLRFPSGAFISNLRKVFDELETIKHERYNGKIREPFATLIHYDFWTNNMMVKFENCIPVASKILDFQMCDYNMCASDVLFFICSSIRLEDLKGSLDYFLHFYYDQLVLNLTKLGCLKQELSYEAFYEDVGHASKFELLHFLMIGNGIFTKKEQAKNIGEIQTDRDVLPSEIHENLTLRLDEILHEFVERGWI